MILNEILYKRCNSKEKENEKNTNINVNPISSRKNSNSKIYCEPIIYGTPNKAKSKLPFKENGRNSQSEKKTSTLKKANELKVCNFAYSYFVLILNENSKISKRIFYIIKILQKS